jgi:NADPH-dependent 2,4-dienoyl-CoA reductase/sulfur reductase-like enzyme
MSKKEKLIILGGSAAGPSAAARAKRINPDLEITIFEQGSFVSYGS